MIFIVYPLQASCSYTATQLIYARQEKYAESIPLSDIVASITPGFGYHRICVLFAKKKTAFHPARMKAQVLILLKNKKRNKRDVEITGLSAPVVQIWSKRWRGSAGGGLAWVFEGLASWIFGRGVFDCACAVSGRAPNIFSRCAFEAVFASVPTISASPGIEIMCN